MFWRNKSPLGLPPAFTLVSCSAYLTLKMEVKCSSKTPLDCQWTTWCYIPEDSTIQPTIRFYPDPLAIQSTPYVFNTTLILSCNPCLGLQNGLFIQIFQLIFCMHSSSLPYIFALPNSSLVNSYTNNVWESMHFSSL
jgi:hypothetical protein